MGLIFKIVVLATYMEKMGRIKSRQGSRKRADAASSGTSSTEYLKLIIKAVKAQHLEILK